MSSLADIAARDMHEFDNRDLHTRAWDVVEHALEDPKERLVLIHASALLHAVLAHADPDPVATLQSMLADHSASAVAHLSTALAMDADTPPTERKS